MTTDRELAELRDLLDEAARVAPRLDELRGNDRLNELSYVAHLDRFADDAAALIEKLAARLGERDEDAERYRWLRANWAGLITSRDGTGRVEQIWVHGAFSDAPPESVDAAIDAARTKESA